MKKITKVSWQRSLWAAEQKVLLIMLEGSREHVLHNFSEKQKQVVVPNRATKVERGTKEDERVLQFYIVMCKYFAPAHNNSLTFTDMPLPMGVLAQTHTWSEIILQQGTKGCHQN